MPASKPRSPQSKEQSSLFSLEQEAICHAIDQRNNDQLTLFKLNKLQEPKQLYWRGQLIISYKAAYGKRS